jgi:hypothetical protein
VRYCSLLSNHHGERHLAKSTPLKVGASRSNTCCGRMDGPYTIHRKPAQTECPRSWPSEGHTSPTVLQVCSTVRVSTRDTVRAYKHHTDTIHYNDLVLLNSCSYIGETLADRVSAFVAKRRAYISDCSASLQHREGDHQGYSTSILTSYRYYTLQRPSTASAPN